MASSARMQRRIREFAAELREEFGLLALVEHSCLLEAAEEWGIQVGDERKPLATALLGLHADPRLDTRGVLRATVTVHAPG